MITDFRHIGRNIFGFAELKEAGSLIFDFDMKKRDLSF